MVAIRDQLITDFLKGKDTLTPAYRTLRIEASATNKVIDAQWRDVTKSINDASKSVRRFDSRLLSVMFTGMVLSRVGMKGLRTLSNTYLEAAGNTTALGRATTRLSASWEFLKFSIVNALDNPFFIKVIDFLVGAVNWTSQLINKYPALGIAIIGAFAVLAVGGTVMMTIAQFKLFWDATFGVGGFFARTAAQGMGTAAAEAGSVTGAGAAMMSTLTTLVAGGILVYVGLDILGKKDEPITTSTLITHLGLATIAGYKAGSALGLGGPLGALAAFTITLIFEVETEQARKNVADVIDAFNVWLKEPEKLTEEQRLWAPAWQGTTLPEMAVRARREEEAGILEKVLGIPANLIGNITTLWGEVNTYNTKSGQAITNTSVWTGNLNELDYSMTGGSVVPSLSLMNEQLSIQNNLYPLLSEQTIAFTDTLAMEEQAHISNTNAIIDEATALRELAAARREAAATSGAGVGGGVASFISSVF